MYGRKSPASAAGDRDDWRCVSSDSRCRSAHEINSTGLGSDEPAALSCSDVSVREDRLSSAQRSSNDAAEGLPYVRAHLVPLLKIIVLQRERLCRVDEHEIGIVAGRRASPLRAIRKRRAGVDATSSARRSSGRRRS